MLNTESNGTLDQSSLITYVGLHPINVIPELDIIEKLRQNISQIEELCSQLSFTMREIRTVMKI